MTQVSKGVSGTPSKGAQSGIPQILTSLAQALRRALPTSPPARNKTTPKSKHTSSRLSNTAAKTLATQCLFVALGVRCAHLIDTFAPTRRECEILADVLAAQLCEDGSGVPYGGDELFVLIIGDAAGEVEEGGQVFVVNQRLVIERDGLERCLAVDVRQGARPRVIHSPDEVNASSRIVALLRERISSLEQEVSSQAPAMGVSIWALTKDTTGDTASSSQTSLDRASIPLAGWLLDYECLYAFAEEKGVHSGDIRLLPLDGSNADTDIGLTASEDAATADADTWDAHRNPTPNNLGNEQLILFQIFLASSPENSAGPIIPATSGSPEARIPLLAFSIPACCGQDAWRWIQENGEGLGFGGLQHELPAGDAEALLIGHVTSRISRKLSERLARAVNFVLELSITAGDDESSVDGAHGPERSQAQKEEKVEETAAWLRDLRVEVVTSRQELPLVAL